jgi:MFS family permease
VTAAEAPPPSDSRFSVLREAAFRWFSLSRFFGATAMTLLRAAIAYQVYELSGNEISLGNVGLMQFVAAFSMFPLAGPAADSFDRRRVIQLAQLVPMLCSLSLVVLSLQQRVTLPILYAVVALSSLAGAFEQPARASLLPALVSRDNFLRAVPISTILVSLGFASGPPAMGFMSHWAGYAGAYGLHAALVAGSLFSLARLPRVTRLTPAARVTWQAVAEGISFVRRSPIVLGCMTLDMFAVLLGGATALLPVYAKDILRVDTAGYGLLTSASEVGSLAMSILILTLSGLPRAGASLLWTVAAFGAATAAFGLSRSFPLSVALFALVGMADQVSVVLRQTIVQLSTPDELRGRVSAVNFVFIGASNQLGAAESGYLAAATSATFAVVSGGIGAIVVALVVAWRNRPLRSYRLG